MEHVAIDLGGKESQICVRSSSGEIVLEQRCATMRLGRFLETRPPSRVIVETCSEAFSVADVAAAAGHEVRVVPSMLVKSLLVGDRGVKNDRRDAQALSLTSTRVDLPSVHIPSLRARELRSRSTSRDALVASRTQLVNSVRGWMRQRGVRIRTGGTITFATRVRDVLGAVPNGAPDYIEHMLVVVDSLNAQIKLATAEIGRLAEEDGVCTRLMTVPGVGPVTAVRFVAAIDDIQRFRSAHAVQAYLGLVPGERSSSEHVRKTGLTKAGPPQVRAMLGQAAHSAMRTRRHDPMVIWADQVAARRGWAVAVTALARKLAGILFALWRDGSTYDASRGATPPHQA